MTEEQNTDPKNTKGEKLTLSIENLLRMAANPDPRELDNIRTARAFISSLGLTRGSRIALIGPGQPDGFFWSDIISIPQFPPQYEAEPLSTRQWERLALETGGRVDIFEPDIMAATVWGQVKNSLVAKGYNCDLVIPQGKNAHFENSGLSDRSIDLIVLTNLFGTPTLLLNDEESEEIACEIGRVLKQGGHLIVGDRSDFDADITQTRLDVLRKNGCELHEVKRCNKGETKWIAYGVQK